MRNRLMIGLAVWLAASSMVAGETDVKFEDLTLSATATKMNYLGQDDVNITFTLRSKSEQSVCSVSSADLAFVIQNVENPKQRYVEKLERDRAIIREGPPGTGEFIKWVRIEKNYIKMTPDSESTYTVNFRKLFATRLSCGTYSVSAVYEGKVKTTTNASFSIVLDYERSVPALIDLIDVPKPGSWARDQLFSIVGKPIWKPSQTIRSPEPQERIDSEVAALRKWWKENKDLILLVEARSKEAESLRRSIAETERSALVPSSGTEGSQKPADIPEASK